MGASALVVAQITPDRGAGLGNVGIGPQVDLLILDGPPETLHEDIVAPNSLAIHADFVFAGDQHLDEIGRCELATLIRVKDLRRAVTRKRLLHSLNAKIHFQRDRHAPYQDAPGEPAHKCSKLG